MIETIAELGLQDRINFTGYLNNISDYLADMDLIVVTSKDEALPFSILEASLLSIPIIANSVGGINEIIKDGYNGLLIINNNPNDIADKIMLLYSNQEYASTIGRNGKEHIANNFNSSYFCKEIIKEYHKI